MFWCPYPTGERISAAGAHIISDGRQPMQGIYATLRPTGRCWDVNTHFPAAITEWKEPARDKPKHCITSTYVLESASRRGGTVGRWQYIVAGMCGSGTAVSFNAGRCLCNRILGNTSEPDDYPEAYFSPTRLLSPESHRWPELEMEGEAVCHQAERDDVMEKPHPQHADGRCR